MGFVGRGEVVDRGRGAAKRRSGRRAKTEIPAQVPPSLMLRGTSVQRNKDLWIRKRMTRGRKLRIPAP